MNKRKNSEFYEKRWRKRQDWHLGCGEYLAVLTLLLMCAFLTFMGVAPSFVYDFLGWY